MFLFSPSGPATTIHNSMQSVSGSDAADLKNNLTQTRSFEFSDSTEIGEILIPFSPAMIVSMILRILSVDACRFTSTYVRFILSMYN